MEIIEHEVRSSAGTIVPGIHRHLFTQDEYYALGVAGIFGEARVELIKGQIIDMAPIGDSHAAINDPLADLLRDLFGSGYAVRTQAPIALDSDTKSSNPQPDIVVVVGTWRDYLSRKPAPSDIKLIVEISDSTLTYDRTIKAALYATAGIPEYWIVNLVDNELEVYRNSIGVAYSERTIYKTGQSVELLFTTGKSIAVAGFMP